MSSYVKDEKGRTWEVLGPCIFCSWTTSVEMRRDGWANSLKIPPCVGNAGGDHIYEDSFPPEVMAVIKASRPHLEVPR